MYIKLKNPRQRSLTTGLWFAWIVSALIIIIATVGLLIYGSPLAFAVALWDLLREMGKDDFFGAFICAVLLLCLPIVAVCGFWEYFKNRHKWKNPNFVRAVDFLESDLLLVSDHPTALPYQETFYKLIIELKRVHAGKNNYVPAVVGLSLCLDTKPIPEGDFRAPDFSPENIHYVPAYKLDHVAKFEDIFPFLEFSSRFRHFEYTFYLHNSHEDLKKYRDFVDKQIQNHLTCGTHLCLSTGQVIGRCVLGLFCLLMLFPPSLLLAGTHAKWFDLLFLTPIVLIFFYIFIFQILLPLWKQYKAYKTLKKFGLK